MKWNAQQYETQHDFVFKYGAGLLDQVPETATTVLDVGCGTGDLTDQLRQRGYAVVGIDQSAEMVAEAQRLYPDTHFDQQDIVTMPITHTYDVVFSNAVFHWITDQNQLLVQVNQTLNPNGQLVCEFGAAGNVATICSAFGNELHALGMRYQVPFFFPETAIYQHLLEKHKFEVLDMEVYDRPTVLRGGAEGLGNWVQQFFESDLSRLSNTQQSMVISHMADRLHDKLWVNDHWEADYRRLRVVARKVT
ncbi:class I SAM-dependent methyltransferase [Bifidobacterium aquikefiri]|uniref:class I SAM-dependent methyltransferase n=2 Tax=Bifidobacterium aquikefiri TaxID=1653207 RepID=UPI0039EC619B